MAEDIEQIKWMLYGVYLILFMLGGVMFFNYRLNTNRINSSFREDFFNEAQKLDDTGQLRELQVLAEARLSENKSDSFAYYYLGISHFKQKQYSRALKAFTDLQSVDPAWEKAVIQQYIDEIKLQMNGPQRTVP
ncbi:tetratricopeptide repeat protein [Shewanella sp. 10N.7]|uniref:tetratricopeptide repeat protein n=1 Tax=Shewanella sp. 10N.7 TaxID=2885093 RepID=UPI001E3CA63E|nr:tetratricopeptide repeat protein [Shewanella sp. 10N.7]MCC4832825.1 tetratricopeptide repeat protein [Shewanella sp. 10N.7]